LRAGATCGIAAAAAAACATPRRHFLGCGTHVSAFAGAVPPENANALTAFFIVWLLFKNTALLLFFY
jgi:hypothetical protein